jgi:hypothetical protein
LSPVDESTGTILERVTISGAPRSAGGFCARATQLH